MTQTFETQKLRELSRSAWQAGVEAVHGQKTVADALSRDPQLVAETTLCAAVGKAAAPMLRALPEGLERWLLTSDSRLAQAPAGAVVLCGDHPLPSTAGLEASRRLLERVRALGSQDRFLFLLSGGASSLFEVPRPGIEDLELIETYRLLVHSGIDIASINRVRTALSAVKGGGLAAAARPAVVTTLAISDVPGNRPETIGSGPSWPAPQESSSLGSRPKGSATAGSVATDDGAAFAELLGRRLWRRFPESVRAALASVPPSPERNENDTYTVVASREDAASAAALWLEGRGVELFDVRSDGLDGPCSRVAGALAEELGSIGRDSRPRALVYAGETTVEVPARHGVGGRNRHLAVELAGRLAGLRGFAVTVAGTDGEDGDPSGAGATVDGGTATRLHAAGYPLDRVVAEFDSGTALAAVGEGIAAFDSATNVADLLVAVVAPSGVF